MSLGAAVVFTLVIYVTTQRIKWTETRGSCSWRTIGLRFRRVAYPHGKFPDERSAAEDDASFRRIRTVTTP